MAVTNTITVGHTVKLNLVEFNDEPVLTFRMIDQVHGRAARTAKKRFGENRQRFTEGKHYYLVPHAQAAELRPYGVEVPPRGLTLITKRGYLLLVKSFTDDLAWEVQEQLVDYYFERQGGAEASHQEPPITIEQLQAIRSEMCNCSRYLSHRSGSFSQTLYRQMKADLGYDKIERMPMSQFDDAIQWIKKYQPICHQVYDMSCYLEREFMRRIKERDYDEMMDVPQGILEEYQARMLMAH